MVAQVICTVTDAERGRLLYDVPVFSAQASTYMSLRFARTGLGALSAASLAWGLASISGKIAALHRIAS